VFVNFTHTILNGDVGYEIYGKIAPTLPKSKLLSPLF